MLSYKTDFTMEDIKKLIKSRDEKFEPLFLKYDNTVNENTEVYKKMYAQLKEFIKNTDNAK